MTSYTRDGHSGTGPGAITRDGCSVQMYARLPTHGEPDVVLSAVPPGASLLELGAGAGRMTRPLTAGGLTVTAVDESPEMLAQIGDTAATVLSAIEDLHLGRQFDAVLLASFLINSADDAQRDRLLRACSRHTAPGGCVLLQRERDGLHEALSPGDTWDRGAVKISVVSLEPLGDGVWRTCIGYAFEDVRWTQTFFSRNLTEPQFEAALADVGLAVEAYLTDDRTWARARVERAQPGS